MGIALDLPGLSVATGYASAIKIKDPKMDWSITSVSINLLPCLVYHENLILSIFFSDLLLFKVKKPGTRLIKWMSIN